MNPGLTYTDGELAQMLCTGNREAFAAIYQRYWTQLYNAAYKRLSSHELAEDALQEVFARIWINREMHTIENLFAYLQVAVYHECLKTITRVKQVTAFYQPFENMLAAANGPEEQLVAKELMELIYNYAATLPKKRRAIFLMHVQSKLSTKEIAEQLGVSVKTVQNQLNTSLSALKTHLGTAILIIITRHL